MRTGELTIFRVVKIDKGKVTKGSTGSGRYVHRGIKIFTESGDHFEIGLFGGEPKDLFI